MAKRRLVGKRILLTGASSGIGWHLAVALAKAGARLLCTARREEKLIDLTTQLMQSDSESRHHFLAGDICDPVVREQLKNACMEHFSGLDILINNAGVGALGRFSESNSDVLRQVMEVNFFAPVELIRTCLPLLKDGNQPIIVNISSVLGHRAVPLKSEYSASKFALHGFSDALRAELAEEGIDVTLISPSTTDSDFFANSLVDHTGKNWKGKRAMSPESVSKAAVKAIEKGVHEIILTVGGKSLVLADRIAPTLTNKAIERWGQ